ncbi:M20 peptidase aminoacylase family protein [Lederbergia lenta]|uniref:Amidohydrolase n=1 Tax=Lederbergia lenta TaxID=1467 RepID=A0A2X4WUP9_LEDLE|nr:M20 peptidase aminoacylase family protein [Lederbergia lenta]MCM3112217.1 M20 peptidase aminoacylase family protein [Lederbergia lenta]MEC2323385.1 M20 peptidase aminoacylase family protein [Lederbergia lenta]SQI63338.1 amidohydrolase [Lederbergia lenta]
MQQDIFHKKVFDTFSYLHANPEISWKEQNTTFFIKQQLEMAGCNVTTFDDCTGVIGDFGGGSKGVPVVAIRADMDALWQEVDGIYKANHSCGHDAHMTMVLGVLWKLEANPQLREKISVRFIFQPAEEVGKGALTLAEKGVVDDVDYLFGIHLRPSAETPNGFATPAIIHGATGAIECEIVGEDAHGARPHLTSNAIEIGMHIVNLLNTVHLDPTVPHSIKVTKFHAGGKNTNIIPGQASLSLDLRAQTNEHMKLLQKKVYNILELTEQLFETRINIVNDYSLAAAKVAPDAEKIARQAIVNVLGENYTVPALLTPGGDDFHFYTISKPTLKATMIGLGCDLKPGLHHPSMTFDKQALFNGIDILTEMVLLTSRVKR